MSDEARLLISFINVGDGDAILVRETGGFTMLIDTGRENVLATPDSRRLSCRDYLRKQGVKRINALIITHLHEDHAGGLQDVMNAVSVEAVYSAYFPAVAGFCADEPEAEKSVRGLIYCLNKWASDVEALKKRGTRLVAVDKTTRLAFTNRLAADIIVRDEASCVKQHAVYDAMLASQALTREQKYAASKLRNANSLRTRLYFAGRTVELAGDCYGSLWEKEAAKCDIFKVPHHGDRKAVTAALAKALSPRDAVISCANVYIPEKDRPSGDTARALREAGCRVWYVDSFSDGTCRALKRESLDFVIFADGRIIPSV